MSTVTETTPAPATVATVTESATVTVTTPPKSIIASARVKAHLSTFSINRVPKRKIKEIKSVLDPLDRARQALAKGIVKTDDKGTVVKNAAGETEYRALTDEEKSAFLKVTSSVSESDEKALREELVALQKCLYRFSKGSFPRLVPVIETMLRELIECGFEGMEKSSKHIIKTSHFHWVEDGSSVKKAESLMLFPLFSNLSNWRNVKSQFMDNDSDEKTEVTEPELTNDKSSFVLYIRELLKNMKKIPKYANLRMSNSAKDYLDNIVVEFLRNFSHTILDILESNKTKTVSGSLILAALHDHMKDGECFDERLKYHYSDVVDPAASDANGKLPEESRKPESELPKIKCLVVSRHRIPSSRRAFIDGLVGEVPADDNSECVKEVSFAKPEPTVNVVKVEPKPEAPKEAKPPKQPKAPKEPKEAKDAKPKKPRAKKPAQDQANAEVAAGASTPAKPNQSEAPAAVEKTDAPAAASAPASTPAPAPAQPEVPAQPKAKRVARPKIAKV